ncbi:hypothetical protein EV360DRAFT_85289 [Lentinula raphanica]|nr:hypothetical protein EV360DRAFT_85289 [Lentinula raphanica]
MDSLTSTSSHPNKRQKTSDMVENLVPVNLSGESTLSGSEIAELQAELDQEDLDYETHSIRRALQEAMQASNSKKATNLILDDLDLEEKKAQEVLIQRYGSPKFANMSLGNGIGSAKNSYHHINIRSHQLSWNTGMKSRLGSTVTYQFKSSITAGRLVGNETLVGSKWRSDNWMMDLVWRFLDDRFPIPTKDIPHLRTTRSFITYIQKKNSSGMGKVLSAANTYP